MERGRKVAFVKRVPSGRCVMVGSGKTISRLLVLAVVLLALGLVSCGEDHYVLYPDRYFQVIVQNETPIELTIYLDGGYLCRLLPYARYRADSIIEGQHLLEAVDETQTVVASRSFYLHDTFIWILE
jgi:hypothetical protein